jgi:glyoxylase I family protein
MNSRIKVMVIAMALGALMISGCCGNKCPFKSANKGIRFEHIALNVKEPDAVAKWYRDNMGMKIVRSDGKTGGRRFVSDAGGNMMLEFYYYEKAESSNWAAVDNHTLHIAFAVDDVQAVHDKLIAAGAKTDWPIETTPDGDVITIVRDPWGISIQLLKRAEPML